MDGWMDGSMDTWICGYIHGYMGRWVDDDRWTNG
jgi:hypothetical protein